MGYVYLALHLGPAGVAKMVVLKHLRNDFATSDSARSMFLNEARLATRLNHPNIVQTLEIVEEEDLYLVMEFLDGQPLSRILKGDRTQAFPLSTKLRILIKALEGLHYVHELRDYDGRWIGAVHRDVSPQNIMVTYDGHVKLVDFGVAKVDGGATVTAAGVFKGKVRYSSPEQILCTTVDRRTDVFAVGMILWEMLSGRRMWEGQAEAAVFFALASGNIPHIRQAWPDVPPILEAICTKALAKDVSARFATALEFRNALADYVNAMQEPSPDLGSAMVSAFTAERNQLRAIMDTQLRATREASSGSTTARPGSQAQRTPQSQRAQISPPSERSLSRGGATTLELGTQNSILTRHSRAPRFAGLLAIAGILAGVAVIAVRAFGPEAPAAAPAVAVERVHLTLKASPPGARFTLDGTPLDANPFEGDFPRDEAPHHVTIHADGFEARDLDTVFTRDVHVDEALKAIPAAAVPRAVTTPPPRARAAPAPVFVAPPTPQGTRITVARGSQRPIDEGDPYKQ